MRKLRTRLERQMELEDKLRENRIQTQTDTQPFVLFLMSKEAWLADPKNKGKDKDAIAAQKMLSVEYRRIAFEMCIRQVRRGCDCVQQSDAVFLRAGVMRDFGKAGKDEVKEMAALLGIFLLEIRRSLGNESTKLKSWDMLEWFIKEAREFKKQ